MRHWLSDLCSGKFDEDSCDRIAITTHELLENALKYSIPGAVHVKIEMVPGTQFDVVTVRVTNPSSPEYIRVLEENLRHLDEAISPDAHYLNRMRETANRVSGSGLGLARIAAENSMQIDLVVEGSLVHLSARGLATRRSRMSGAPGKPP